MYFFINTLRMLVVSAIQKSGGRDEYFLMIITLFIVIKIEEDQGSGDDKGLSNIALLCRNRAETFQDIIISPVIGWGTWTEIFKCPDNQFLSSFRLQVEPDEASKMKKNR